MIDIAAQDSRVALTARQRLLQPRSWPAAEQDGKDRSPKLRDYDKKMKKLETQNASPGEAWPSGKLKKKKAKK